MRIPNRQEESKMKKILILVLALVSLVAVGLFAGEPKGEVSSQEMPAVVPWTV